MEFEVALDVANDALFASAGRRLTPIETAILRGAWQRQTYEAIAAAAGYSDNYLKLDVGPKLWKLLSDAFGEKVTKPTFPSCVERHWRRQGDRQAAPSPWGIPTAGWPSQGRAVNDPLPIPPSPHSSPSPHPPIPPSPQPSPSPLTPPPPHPPAATLDWGEAPDASVFYGRTEELATLTQWVLGESPPQRASQGCRLIALLGMGGMGKSTLSVKLAQQVQGEFDCMVWRSLRNAPPLATLLADLIPVLSSQSDTEATPARLLHWLRTRRCLLMLDNLETLMLAGERAGQYQPGYEAYGDLLRVLGETTHQSCVVLTSREKPAEINTFEAVEGRVRSLPLSGSWEASLALLSAKKLLGTEAEKRRLCEFYNCSPLALKIVAASIQSLFDGDIAAFLAEETMVFNGLRKLLEQQFDRLTALEQTVVYWLAINRNWTSIAELMADIAPAVTRPALLETLESLTWRAMIEKQAGQYTLQPVVMEFVSDRLIQALAAEILTAQLDFIDRFALVKTTVLDTIAHSQRRLLLAPLATHVRSTLGDARAMQTCLQAALDAMRAQPVPFFAYGVGNLINLALELQLDLSRFDFSRLKIRQVNFQGKPAARLNLAHCELRDCFFTQTFGGILSLAFSPDNDCLALGDSNGAISLWETTLSRGDQLDLKQPLAILLGHTSWVGAVAWHPSQPWLLSGSEDRTLKLWDVTAGQCLRTFVGHQKSVWWVAWSPDGSQIVSASGDRTLKLWHPATGECLQTLIGHTSAIYCVVWSPDGTLLASGGEDRTVRLWDAATGACLKTLAIDGAWVRRLAWSPDGRQIAVASADVCLWDWQAGDVVATLATDALWVDSLAWHPNGSLLASGSSDRTITLWSAPAGDRLKTLRGHQDLIWCLHWSADGTTLASGSHDQTVRLWNTETGQCQRTIQGFFDSVRAIAWSPVRGASPEENGQQLASSSSDKTVKLWQVATGACLATLGGHQGWVYDVSWQPGGPLVASAAGDAAIKLWDTQTHQCVKTLWGHTSWVFSAAWSPDGRRIASGSSQNDLTARLWDAATGDCLHVLAGHQSWIWWVKWSPDGNILATAADDQCIKLWDTQTGACLQTLGDDRLLPITLAWSPDGTTLATSGTDATIRLWTVQTGCPGRDLVGHLATVWAVDWHPKGRHLASASDDGTVRVWDVASGTCLQVLLGHQTRIWNVAWNPDPSAAATLASSSLDGTIRLWNTATGDCLRVLRSDRPYEAMNITGIQGLSEAQQATLRALGAIQD